MNLSPVDPQRVPRAADEQWANAAGDPLAERGCDGQGARKPGRSAGCRCAFLRDCRIGGLVGELVSSAADVANRAEPADNVLDFSYFAFAYPITAL